MRQQDSFKTRIEPPWDPVKSSPLLCHDQNPLTMEISYGITRHLVWKAAFLCPTNNRRVREAIEEDNACPNTSALRWTNSTTNPANVPETLDACGVIQWCIDGSNPDGPWTSFYALPMTLRENGPLPLKNIEVLLPNPCCFSPAIRRILEMPAAQGACGPEVNRFAVAKFVRRVLSCWAGGIYDFDSYYCSLPYGSKIKLHMYGNGDIDKTTAEVERKEQDDEEWFPRLDYLQRRSPSSELPPAIRIEQLGVDRQLHDTVSLVRIPDVTREKLWVLKTSEARYLIKELKTLLTLSEREDGNPAFMGKPAYLVTQIDEDDDTVVLGMILEYCQKGSLAAVIDQRRVAGTLDLKTKFKWAQQLASAVLNLTYSTMRYHSSLKPDNILVNDDDTLRIIDMEQGGNWDEFMAPEISYQQSLSRAINAWPRLTTLDMERRVRQLLAKHRHWEQMEWHERTMAEVYSVGKILWCIFEGWSHTKNGLGERWFIPIDHGCDFPNFHQTPQDVATLILDCVRGSEDLEDDRRWDDDIAVVDGVAYPKGRTGRDGEPKATALVTVTFAKEMWNRKYEVMERYLSAKARWDKDKWKPGAENPRDVHLVGIPLRPDLMEVCERLRKLEEKYILD